MNELLLSLASDYARIAHPSRNIEGGTVFFDGGHSTVFCEAAGFYTLAVAATLCEEERKECKHLFTEIAKKSLTYFLASAKEIGVCDDGESHFSPEAAMLFYEGALLLGEKFSLPPAYAEALSSCLDTTVTERILAGDGLSAGGIGLLFVASRIRIALIRKETLPLPVLIDFCRACVRAGDVADPSGDSVFSLPVRAYRYKMYMAESLFARLIGISLALPEPPRVTDLPEKEYLNAEERAFYACAASAAALLRYLLPSPLLSEGDITFREGERVGVDGFPFVSSDTVLLRGGERLCGASGRGGGELLFLPYPMPRLLTDSFFCRVNGIFPLLPEVKELAVDAEVKGGFSLRLCRLHSTALYKEGDRESSLVIAEEHIAYAALPDDETVLMISVTKAKNRSFISESTGLSISVPVSDDGVYYYADAKHPRRIVRRRDGDGEVGCYLNIDDAMGIVTSRPMTLTRGDGERPDVFSVASEGGGRRVEAGDVLSSVSLAGALGGIRKTRALQEGFLTLSALPDGVYSASAVGANRKRYTLLYNLSGKDFLWEGRTVENGRTALLVWSR